MSEGWTHHKFMDMAHALFDMGLDTVVVPIYNYVQVSYLHLYSILISFRRHFVLSLSQAINYSCVNQFSMQQFLAIDTTGCRIRWHGSNTVFIASVLAWIVHHTDGSYSVRYHH